MSKKSETVYPGIWGILKLSVLVNQKILEMSIETQSENFSSNFEEYHRLTLLLHYEGGVCVS